MLCGFTPFRGDTQEKILANIKENNLQWPSDVQVSPDCKKLVRKLLCTEVSKRLGSENGAHDIKSAKWFKNLNFVRIGLDPPERHSPCIPDADTFNPRPFCLMLLLRFSFGI
jgi:serine/threonine protein kinase